VVYVGEDSEMGNPAKFSWDDTPGVISRTITGKSELIIPDEWPEFPMKPGLYHIAVTSKDDMGNQSDPLLLSGIFKFIAPPSPSKGGIETFPPAHPGSGTRAPSPLRQGRTIIEGGLEEVRNNREVQDAYLGGE
jgi:hypothetical protein